MSEHEITWQEANNRTAVAAGQPAPFPDFPGAEPVSPFPVAGLAGAIHISTGGLTIPGGIWIDGVKVK